ncbi:MAG TPA: cation:proton antiporter [Acidobacteriota bacterium]|nr:cation:proton antiporter [Acidobacteriota bacterium]
MDAIILPFRDLAYVFIAAITGGLIAWRLRQPIIIGYVLAGVVISPLTPGPAVSNIHSLELFAEIGVVLLMFSVGMEFSVKELLQSKWVAFLGGPLGIALSVLIGLGVGSLLGWPPATGIVVGAVISVASTMVLTRLLIDQGQLRTVAGRTMVTITLVEDFATIIFIVTIPGIAQLGGGRFLGLLENLGRAALILAPALFFAAKIIPPLLTRVARTQSRELFFLVVLAICLGTAALTSAIGLSLALGAFAAGLIISESGYAHEAVGQLFPVRDAFVAVFFVSMGLLIDPKTLFSNLPILAIIILLIVVGKFVVWTGVVRLFLYPLSIAVPVAIGLTQIGEFSYVLAQVARNVGLLDSAIYNAILAASLVTILLNAGLVRWVFATRDRMRVNRQISALTQGGERGDELRDHVIIGGFGRIGSGIGSAFDTFGVRYSVIEMNPDIVGSIRTRGILAVFGDCSHTSVLERAGINDAALLILTVPDRDRARMGIDAARRIKPNLPIIARADRREDYEFLIQAGATEVIQPETEAAATIIRHACGHYLMLPDWQIRGYLKSFRDAMDSVQRRPAIRPQSVPEVREVVLGNNAFVGRSIREMKLRETYGITVVAIRRTPGESLVNPPADTILQPEDRLRVLGRTDEIDAFAAQFAASDSTISQAQ